jgi:potassium-transporting ATPase KdpC subunit
MSDSLDHRGGGSRTVIGFALFTSMLFGLAYPALSTLAIGALFPLKANGSLIVSDGQVRGSTLLAQKFVDDGFFAARPSAAGFDPFAAAGSNWAPSNPALADRIAADAAAIAAREGVALERIPADLLTASGSGLDPHLSRAAVDLQAPRVARARGLTPVALDLLIDQHSEAPTLGVLGRPRVNIVTLNAALANLRA